MVEKARRILDATHCCLIQADKGRGPKLVWWIDSRNPRVREMTVLTGDAGLIVIVVVLVRVLIRVVLADGNLDALAGKAFA
jgi:hypothetical protein